jgi:hypothetical protein
MKPAEGLARKGARMRGFKITVLIVMLLGGALVTWLTYIQSHGAGISTGILLGLVIVSFLLDHRTHIFATGQRGKDNPELARQIALRQARVTAMRQDGDIQGAHGGH